MWILLGYCLSDRVQGVERLATHLRHFPIQEPPPPGPPARYNLVTISTLEVVALPLQPNSCLRIVVLANSSRTTLMSCFNFNLPKRDQEGVLAI